MAHSQTVPLVSAGDSAPERYRAALRSYFAGELDDALGTLAACETWPGPIACAGLLLTATAMCERLPANAEAFLVRHRSACVEHDPFEYYVLLGKTRSLQAHTEAADACFADAADHAGTRTIDEQAVLALERARNDFRKGLYDLQSDDIAAAFADPAPRAHARALQLRADIFEAQGHYRSQLDDLCAALRITLEHVEVCEVTLRAQLAVALARTAFELCDADAFALARGALDRLPLLPATRSAIAAGMGVQSRYAFLHGDALGAQRLLRRSEEIATSLIDRLSALVSRATVAHLSGSALWAVEELSHAVELASKIDWEHQSVADASVLLEIARTAAESDVTRALSWLSRYQAVRRKGAAVQSHDARRQEAVELYVEGLIRSRAGEKEAATSLLEGAYLRWCAMEHHVRAGLTVAELAKLTGDELWRDAVRHYVDVCGAKAWIVQAEPSVQLPAVAEPVDADAAYARAYRLFLATQFDEALATLDRCERWQAPLAVQALTLRVRALMRLARYAEAEVLLREHAALIAEHEPCGYHVVHAWVRAEERDTAGAEAALKTARSYVAQAPREIAALLGAVSALTSYYGAKVPAPSDLVLAFSDPSPPAQQRAHAIRAAGHMLAGDYRAQIADQAAALEIGEASPDECEQIVSGFVARDIINAGLELSDERAIRLGRTFLERLPIASATTAVHFDGRLRLATHALVAGDALLAQQVLREAEQFAITAPAKVQLHAHRAHLAFLNGNRLWLIDELAGAQQIAETFDWERASARECHTLIELAFCEAEAGTPSALEHLALYQRLSAHVGGLPQYDPLRVRGFVRWVEGVVWARMGQREEAALALEDSYRTFAPIDHHFRAALAAKELVELAGGKRWQDALVRHAQACGAKAWCVPEFIGELDDAYASLTPTQKEIFRAVCGGMSVPEIARDTSRSTFTVNKHLQSIYAAFDVHSRVELRAEAKRRGLT